MTEQAKVTSIEALESFRTSLILYLEKAGRVLDEINTEAVRTRAWLQQDQRLYWENQIRRRAKDLEQKEQELFSARFSELNSILPMHQAAVRAAKHALTEAENKLALLKKWSRQYDHQVAPIAKEVDKLREVLQGDTRKGVAWLAQAIKTLDAYAGMAPPDPGSSLPASENIEPETEPADRKEAGEP
jgi:hypothetical protein